MVLTRFRAARRWFWRTLDAEGVGIFQAIVYIHIGLFAGLYGLLVAGGTPQTVEDAMGPSFNAFWLWLCLAIMTCLAGKMIRWDAGMWFQLTGDLAAFGVLTVYIIATLSSAWWGKAMFALFLTAAIWECVALLIIRDVRRIVIDQKMIRS